MTKEQAIAFHKSGAWKEMSDYQIAVFQLSEDRSCIPFRRVHAAVEATIGRPVWTHEFANPAALLAEIVGTREPPTLQAIIDMIPADKRMIIDLTPPNRDN